MLYLLRDVEKFRLKINDICTISQSGLKNTFCFLFADMSTETDDVNNDPIQGLLNDTGKIIYYLLVYYRLFLSS